MKIEEFIDSKIRPSECAPITIQNIEKMDGYMCPPYEVYDNDVYPVAKDVLAKILYIIYKSNELDEADPFRNMTEWSDEKGFGSRKKGFMYAVSHAYMLEQLRCIKNVIRELEDVLKNGEQYIQSIDDILRVEHDDQGMLVIVAENDAGEKRAIAK